jgi:hypothetical protein
MAQTIAQYLASVGDTYHPISSKPSLQQWDNYQIYSLVCIDYPAFVTFFEIGRAAFERSGNDYYHVWNEYFWYFREIFNTSGIDSFYAQKFIAYQQYSINKIPFDFGTLAESLICQPINNYEHRTHETQLVEYWEANSFTSPNTFVADRQKYESMNIQFAADNVADPFGQFSYITKLEDYYYGNSILRYYAYKDIYTLHNPLIPIPSAINLLNGYSEDPRLPAIINPVIKSNKSGSLKISYYTENVDEPLSKAPNDKLRSIDWLVYDVQIIKDKNIVLPINNCVLGTLILSGDVDLVSEIKNKLELLSASTRYKWSDYFYGSRTQSLFAEWVAIYAARSNPVVPTVTNIKSKYYREYSQVVFRRLSANNNCWGNDDTNYSDLSVDLSHPMFAVDNNRAYNWHIKPVSEGIGTLVMDSPRTIDIHNALDAAKYAIDPTTGKKRTANLGWYINRQSEVLGIRIKPDGTIDEVAEKTINRRLHVDGSTENDTQKFNPNCFGSEGMLVRHVPNKFSPSGTEAGGYRKVKDIPQLLAELHEQANAAMGYQEGTAIEIQLDGQTYRYPNQLALLIELFVTAKQTATYSKGAFFSSVIGEQSIKEVMAGLGLRTVDKFLEFKVAGKTAKLYYKGISASQSIRRKLSAVTTNIGIAIGNII